jgi:poly-gamma-glutamate synthesis protein (capsule biosynthesis protein)
VALALAGALLASGCAASADPAASEPVIVPAAIPSMRAAPPPPAAQPATALPMFASSIVPIDAALAERMSASWRPGCPVPLEDLRYVTFTYLDFEDQVRTGEVVVHADVAEAIVDVFAALFAARYPLRQVRLVDDFGADDTTSMEADNTSAFNCRAVTGGTAWSEHAYGRAIDVNPVENPYVLGTHVSPSAGRDFAARPEAPGVIQADDVVVRAFAAAGWRWGGYWASPIDYQHFSVNGR